jgi:WD40 repeat protein
MLIFEQDIICLDSDPKRGDYQTMEQYSANFNKIFCAKLTFDEKKLAVGTITGSKPQIQIFTVDDKLQFYKNLRPSNQTIKYIDFSVDNDYMVTEDDLGNENYFEMHTDKNIDEKAIDFQLQWLENGLFRDKQIKGVHKNFYSSKNPVTQITKILDQDVVVVGDKMGTIRFYDYPNVKGKNYYESYSDHLYEIQKIRFGADFKVMLSTSKWDKCIYKWEVSYPARDEKPKNVNKHMIAKPSAAKIKKAMMMEI